ncbi:MAG TPA: SCO family protein [Burkholderiales bacterium]
MITLLLTGLTVGGGPALAAPADSPWGANYFPNVSLVNQDGKTLRFYDDMIKDKVVLINFIYLSCHDACPLETAKLRQVQEALGDRVGRDIFMYSVTIDPEHDTPAALKAYAEKFMVGPGWQFLTGKESDITLLRKKLALYRDETLEERNDHTASLIVGNEATGQWLKRSSFDNPKVLARVLGDQLFNYRRPTTDERSYAEAPRTLTINPGEDLFRRRCQVCHTVGAGDTVGPDLLGVTHKRDRAWLARWLKEPDRMLAEKDPIAMVLYEKYNQVFMPNLRLSDGDVEALIGYLEAESQRLGTASGTGPEPGAQGLTHAAPATARHP